MDRATAEAALVTWAALVTGADAAVCQWENAPRVIHQGTLILLSEVSFTEVGADAAAWAYTSNADPLLEMTPTAWGGRLWVVQVSVEVHDQRAATSARAVAQTAALRASWPRARALLTAAGCALASVGPVRRADYKVDGRMVSRALFELRLNTTVSAADTAGRTSYIATVEATATVVDPAGNTLPSAIQPTGDIGP
jgi:hypothetical protein